MDCSAFRFIDYAADVACDLAVAVLNPDAEPAHPVARALALAALLSLGLCGLAWMGAVDGEVWL